MHIYEISNSIPILEKKCLTKNLYFKYYVRYSISQDKEDDNSLLVFDNYTRLETTNPNLKFLKYNPLQRKNIPIGSSLCLVNTIYQKKRPDYKFNYITYNKIPYQSYLDLLLSKLNSLRSKRKTLIIIQITRGGISCFFNGVYGFFPRKHFFFFLLRQFVQKNHKSKKFSCLQLLNTRGEILPPQQFSFLFFSLHLKIKKRYYNSKIKQKRKRKKPYLFRSNFKFVFLSYRNNKKKINF